MVDLCSREEAVTVLDTPARASHVAVDSERAGEHLDDAATRALIVELDDLWPPAGMLDATEPGPLLAALLNTVSLGAVADDELVAYAAAAQRLASWASSREVAATAALTRRVAAWRGVGRRTDQVTPELAAATEIGAALRLSPASARIRVELARALGRLPLTRFALAGGRIDLVRARAVVDGVAGLSDEVAAAVEARVMVRAPGQTAAQLRACLRRAVVSMDPAGAEERRRTKVVERGVCREALEDGMARLQWTAAVEQVESMWTWLTGAAARARAGDLREGGLVRTLDQCRSDVLADLGEHALAVADLPRRHGREPHIGVVVGLSTLLGVDEEPGELVGVGPVTAEVARRVAGEGTWRRLVSDPVTGRLVAMSADTYQPPQELRDAVIARDRTCRGLGCRMPAGRCDLDHRVPWPAGRTEAENLDPACRSWHRVKTLTDVTVEADGQGGLWVTLPSGRCYHRPAEPMLDHPGLLVQPPRDTPPPDDPDPPEQSDSFDQLDVPPF